MKLPIGHTLLVTSLLALGAHAAHAQLAEIWSYDTFGEADGIKLVNLDSDPRLEVVVVVSDFHTGNSSGVVALDDNGAHLWTFQPGTSFKGTAGAGDILGADGLDEVVVCESEAAAYCYLLNSGGGLVATTQNTYYFPGLWGSEPVVKDIDGDSNLDVSIATWGGKLVAFEGATLGVKWTYDAFADHGELFFGKVAVGNVDADSQLEVIAFGYEHGMIILVDGATGAPTQITTGLKGLYGDSAFGNGAVLFDTNDADSIDDIIVASNGTTNAVYAFNYLGTEVWKTPLGTGFPWVTPVLGDTDGDSQDEIILQGSDGTIFRLNNAGSVLGSFNHSPGTTSWFQPVIANVNEDASDEIVNAVLDRLDYSKGSGTSLMNHNDSAAMYWRVVAADINQDGLIEAVVTDWGNNKVAAVYIGRYRLAAGALDSAGGLSSSTNYDVQSFVGQPTDTPPMTSTNYRVRGGLAPVVTRP